MVSEPGGLGAGPAIDKAITVDFPSRFPPLSGGPTPARLQRIAGAMQGFDLILTHNWGAMNAAMAHTLFGAKLGLAPLVHHEDGFNEDEAQELKRSRTWYRRIALGRSSALVVSSRRLEAIARELWHRPANRVVRIEPGVDLSAYGRKPRPDALPRIVKRKDELWLGAIAGLRPIENLPRLVRAFAGLGDEWQLVILGEGPERDAIRAEGMRLEIGHRVHMPGLVADPAEAVGLFDMFALASESERFPVSVLEAMAAGLAVVSPRVGEIAGMVAAENEPYIVPPADEGALAQALAELAGNRPARRRIGEANRAKARAEYGEAAMIAAFRQVYARALGRPKLP